MIVRRFLIPLGLLATAAALLASCRDASPVGVDEHRPAVLTGWAPDPTDDDTTDVDAGNENEDGDSLVSCRPLPYDSVTKTIGPAGGIIEVRHNNWLVVPRGALSAPVQITAVAPSDSVAMIRFQPEGLRFQKSTLLVLAYDNCRVPRRVTPRIALVTDAFDVIEFLTPVDASIGDQRFKKAHRGRYVLGQLQHFSNYAVAW
jgi:hypothetical protein